MEKIGLIGLGTIGTYFTDLLLKDGYPLTVYDLDAERVRKAVEKGARAANSPGDVASQSDIILLALPGSGPVEAVMNGDDGVLNRLRPGQLVIDTGTSRPSTDIHFERLAREKGAGFLDAPITFRGAKGLIMMAGGDEAEFGKGRRVLECLSYKLKHVGAIGQGQVLKLINQMILANVLAAYCEAFEMSVKLGVDTRLLKDFLEFDVPEYLYNDEFTGAGQLSLHYKDLLYLLEIAHDCGANIPISSFVHEIFKATKPYGQPNWMQPGIVTYWRRLNQTER